MPKQTYEEARIAALGPEIPPLNWSAEEVTAFYRLWVDAMESGNYEPSRRGKLRILQEGYSPLGVLCDVFPVGDWLLPRDADSDVYQNFIHPVPYVIRGSRNYSDLIGYIWDNLKEGPLSADALYGYDGAFQNSRHKLKTVARWIRLEIGYITPELEEAYAKRQANKAKWAERLKEEMTEPVKLGAGARVARKDRTGPMTEW